MSINRFAEISGRFAPPVLVGLVAFTARGAAVLRALHDDLFLELDDVWFLELAKNLALGRGLVDWWGVPNTHFPPLFPILLAMLRLTGVDLVVAGRLVCLIAGACCAIATWWVARKMFDDLTGIIAGIFVALHPHMIFYSSTIILPEMAYTLLLVIGLGSWFVSRNKGPGLFRALGYFSFILAYLLRPEAILFFGALGIYDFIDWIKTRPLNFMGALWRALAPIIAFCSVALPYVFYLHNVTGNWALTGKTANVMTNAQCADPTRNDFMRDPRYYSGAMAFRAPSDLNEWQSISFSDHIKRYLRNLKKLAFKARKPVLPDLALILLITGILFDFKLKTHMKSHLWIIGALLPTVTLIPFFYLMTRYFIPYLAFLCIGMARGLRLILGTFILKNETSGALANPSGSASGTPCKSGCHGQSKACPYKGARVLASFALGLALWAGVIAQSSPFLFAGAPQTETWKSTVKWLRQNARPGAVLMSDRPAMAFQTDLKWIVTPRGMDPEKLIVFAENKGACYLMVDRWRKESPPLTSQGTLVEGADLVFKVGNPGFNELIIIKFSKTEGCS